MNTVLSCLRFSLTLLFVAVLSSVASANVSIRFENAASKLVGADARLQLLVTEAVGDGLHTDVTRSAELTAEPADRIEIDETGLVTPLADGIVTVTAKLQDGSSAATELTVDGMGELQSVSFRSQIIPIFTKLGCNGGGCHGKIAGQNGFRLSLLGFEPQDDHKRLVIESRGRRVSLAAPDHSLLLQKTINAVPHGGGARTDKDSYEYRVMRRWIAQGMPYGSEDEPVVTSIDVYPPIRRMDAGGAQQLSVVASYSDGSTEDVTRGTVYESNDPQMAEVTDTGLVQTSQAVGDVAVMARYQGHVAVFRAELPLDVNSEGPQPIEFANVVDRFVYKKLNSLGIPPSPPCDDATFLRRVTLDLTGRIPTLEETEKFLSDDSEGRRAKLVDRLLGSDDHAEYFARKWSAILRNRREGGPLQVTNVLFHRWLKQSFKSNKRYDDFVSELLTATGTVFSNPAVAWLDKVTDQNERVEDISQLFLGQRIQCARCHHHPYEKWSQEDYAGMSAFFSTIGKKNAAGEVTFVSRVTAPSAKHPGTGKRVEPMALDAGQATVAATADPRAELAQWMTSPENPFFAKALVNRYWKHFLARALVEPEDDMRVTNPPSNPELMDALAETFVASQYDLKALIRTICLSRTYQASSDATEENLIDRRSYSRFYPKRLKAETLLDAIDTVAGSTSSFAGMPPGTRAVALPDTGFDSYFLTVFGQPDSKTACECERSSEANLAQSLHLLNSDQMQSKLSDPKGRAAEYAADTTRAAEDKIVELYKVAFSRMPSEGELEAAVEYVGEAQNQKQPWEDLIWALVNSKEFLFNH
jgi:hypothetical protein